MEKQKKLRFNLVDVIFILVLLVGVAFVALRLGGMDIVRQITGGSAPEPYVITFIGDEVPDYAAERIEIGDFASNEEATMNLGTVVDFQLSDALSYNPDYDGKLVLSAKEGYCCVTLMCQVQGTETSTGVVVDGMVLGVGHTMVVRAGDAKLYMVVYDMQKLSESPYANR